MSVSVEHSQALKLRRITVTGLFIAVIFVFTAYLHIPTGSGYTHAGDGIIYLAACILPMPYAMIAGAVGGALADGLSGYPVWIPATIIIKALTVVFFTNKSEKILNIRNIFGIIPSMIICIVGYCAYEGIILTGGFSLSAIIATFPQIPSYLVQVFASSVLFVFSAIFLDRMDFKKKVRL